MGAAGGGPSATAVSEMMERHTVKKESAGSCACFCREPPWSMGHDLKIMSPALERTPLWPLATAAVETPWSWRGSRGEGGTG